MQGSCRMTQLEHQGGPPGLELCHARSTDTAGHSGSRASQSSPRGQELLRPPFSRQLCLKSSKPMVDSLEKSATTPGNPKLPKSLVSSPNEVPCLFDGLCLGWNKAQGWCSSPFPWQEHHGHVFKYMLRSLSISGKAQHSRGTGRGWAQPFLAQPVELLPPSSLEPIGTWHQGQAQGQAPGHFSQQLPSASTSPGHPCPFCPPSPQETPLQCSTVLVQPTMPSSSPLQEHLSAGMGNQPLSG